MQCKAIRKKLIFLLENELHVNESEAIKIHLDNCAECKKFAAELTKTLDIIQEEKQMEVNPFFYTRLKAKLENQQSVQHPFWQPVFAKVLQPAFFSLLLIIGVYSGIRLAQPADNSFSKNQNEIEMIPFLNELNSEPIESFLME